MTKVHSFTDQILFSCRNQNTHLTSILISLYVTSIIQALLFALTFFSGAFVVPTLAGLLKLNCDKALLNFGWQAILEYEQLIEFTGQWYYEYYKNEKTNMLDITISQIDRYEKTAQQKGVKWAL